HGLLNRLVAKIARITKKDPTLFIDCNIVGRVQWFPLIERGENDTFSRCHIRAGYSPPAIVGAFSHNHPALCIELDPVRHAAWRPEHRHLTVFRIIFHNMPRLHSRGVSERDITEIHRAVWSGGYSLSEHASRKQHFQF